MRFYADASFRHSAQQVECIGPFSRSGPWWTTIRRHSQGDRRGVLPGTNRARQLEGCDGSRVHRVDGAP